MELREKWKNVLIGMRLEDKDEEMEDSAVPEAVEGEDNEGMSIFLSTPSIQHTNSYLYIPSSSIFIIYNH